MMELFILTLVCWRLSKMLTAEDGPYDIFERLRQTAYKKDWKLSPFNCFWCTSVWVAIAIALVSGQSIIVGLAISAGAIIIDSWIER